MSRRRLDSWKEIADYFGRDRTVVARWERERGLPVHRVPGGGKARVFAYTDELDAWLQSPPPEPPPRTVSRSVLLAIAIAFLLIGTGAAWWSTRDPGGPLARVEYSPDDVIALDDRGHELFRKSFAGRLLSGRARPGLGLLARADLDGNGSLDNLITVPMKGADVTTGQIIDRLDAYTDSGTLLWTRENDIDPRFGAGQFGAGYQTNFAVPFTFDHSARIAWSQSHHTWWPSILRVLDAHGEVQSVWVHSGALFAVTFLDRPQGPLLLAGGVSNSQSGGALLVLDARHANGSGPEEPGTEFACVDCPGRDHPLHYFVFPPTEMSAAYGVPYSRVYSINAVSNGLEIRARQGSLEPHQGVDVYYYFDDDFRFVRTRIPDDYWLVHQQMEQKGLLHHAAAVCPERKALPAVRERIDGRWIELTAGGEAR